MTAGRDDNAKVGGKNVTITYGRPYAKGQFTIELVPVKANAKQLTLKLAWDKVVATTTFAVP